MSVLRVKYFCLACRCRYFVSPLSYKLLFFETVELKFSDISSLMKLERTPEFLSTSFKEKFMKNSTFFFFFFLSSFKYSQIFLVLVYIREAEYMRMVDQFHNSDFSFHFHQHGFRQFFSINDLDRHLLAQHTVDPKLD